MMACIMHMPQHGFMEGFEVGGRDAFTYFERDSFQTRDGCRTFLTLHLAHPASQILDWTGIRRVLWKSQL